MQYKSSENGRNKSGVPGLFLPQKELPEVKQVSPLPALPEWAESKEETPLSTQSPNNGSDENISERTFQKKERLLTKRGIVMSVGSLCLILLAFWFTSRGPNIASSNNDQSIRGDTGGSGTLYPNQELVISYPVSERVMNVLVKPGDTVVANQPLIQLDPAQLNSQTTQAYNDVIAAQNYLQLVTAKANALTIALAQQKYNYAKNKYQALVTQTSSLTLHKGSLISPMSGVITSVTVNPGDTFGPDDALVTIMDETKVIVHAKIPLVALHTVKIGQSVLVVPSAGASKHFTGIVTAIIPQADAQTDTFEVWVEIPNTDHLLLPGMSVYVHIQNPTKP